MKFVIFHGSFGNPQENWIPQLKIKLETLGQEVIIPKFPCEDWDEFTKKGSNQEAKNQNLKNWFKVFEKQVLPKINKGEKICFIGHSLGPVFILHVVEKYNVQLDCAIFVSPFLSSPPGIWQFDLVNKTFYKTSFDFEKLKKLIPTSYALYSDTDPYVNRNQAILFGKAVDSSIIFLRKAGHMGGDVKLTELPLVFDLCTTRLNLSLYQKYLTQFNEKKSSNYIRSKYPTIIHLKPEELDDEGSFHFQNLKKSGFATFMSGSKNWDPRRQYFEDGRNSVKRLKELIRVFLIEKISDLKRPNLLKQIELDSEVGIKTYLCMLDEIKEYGDEPDFGIWDDDYVCTIYYKKNKEIKEFVLDSRPETLNKANQWKQKILQRATKINNVDKDVYKFIKDHS